MTLQDLTERRDGLKADAAAILRAAELAKRNLTSEEEARYRGLLADLETVADAIEDQRDAELREARATAYRSAVSSIEHRGGHALATEVRAIGGTGSNAFVPTAFAPFFVESLTAEAVALRSGINVIRTDRDSLVIPHLTSDGTAAFYAPGTQISTSTPTAEQITATPRKIAELVAIPNEDVTDSNPSVLDVYASALVRSVALKFDAAFFEGDGSGSSFVGLANVEGIGEVEGGGAAPSNFDLIADALGELKSANANGTPVIVMHPRTWQSLLKVKGDSNVPVLQAGFAAGEEPSIYGSRVLLSSQLSITEGEGEDESSVFVYVPRQIHAVIRNDVRVEIDRSLWFDYDQTAVRAIMRADVVVPNPAAVVRISGITA